MPWLGSEPDVQAFAARKIRLRSSEWLAPIRRADRAAKHRVGRGTDRIFTEKNLLRKATIVQHLCLQNRLAVIIDAKPRACIRRWLVIGHERRHFHSQQVSRARLECDGFG